VKKARTKLSTAERNLMRVSELSALEREKEWAEYRAGLRRYPPGWERLIEAGVTLEEIRAAIAEANKKLQPQPKRRTRVIAERQRTTNNGQLTAFKKNANGDRHEPANVVAAGFLADGGGGGRGRRVAAVGAGGGRFQTAGRRLSRRQGRGGDEGGWL
jgi:DNA-binding transcriptional MerR regulator